MFRLGDRFEEQLHESVGVDVAQATQTIPSTVFYVWPQSASNFG